MTLFVKKYNDQRDSDQRDSPIDQISIFNFGVESTTTKNMTKTSDSPRASRNGSPTKHHHKVESGSGKSDDHSRNGSPSTKRVTKAVRGQCRNDKPLLNDADMVEWLPGARPQCTGPERAQFFKRSENLWRQEQIDESIKKWEDEKQFSVQMETDINMLCDMFPILDRSLVVTYYNETTTLEQTCEKLMEIQGVMEKEGVMMNPFTTKETTAEKKDDEWEEVTEDPSDPIIIPPEIVSSSSSTRRRVSEKALKESDFPTLVDKDGWEVCNVEKLEELTQVETPRKWADMANLAKDLPAPKASSPVKKIVKHVEIQKETDIAAEGDEYDDEYDLRCQMFDRRHGDSKKKSKRCKAPTAPHGEDDGYSSGAAADAEASGKDEKPPRGSQTSNNTSKASQEEEAEENKSKGKKSKKQSKTEQGR